MPGHVKLGKAGEPDPDPSEYLIVSLEMKREDQAKPYDTKKSYWVPDGQGGYKEAMLEEDDGTKAKVIINGYEVSQKHIIFVSIHHFLIQLFYKFTRKKPSSLKSLVKSILPSLRNVRIWPT